MMSRPKRWESACARALDALNEIKELQDEYQDTYDNMPENLQSSPYGEKLSTVADLDIDGAISIVEECDQTDLPLGFGRD
jgi:hypothetical protein